MSVSIMTSNTRVEPMGRIRSFMPIMENMSSLEEAGTESTKLPSPAVKVPMVVPTAETDTPTRGSP